MTYKAIVISGLLALATHSLAGQATSNSDVRSVTPPKSLTTITSRPSLGASSDYRPIDYPMPQITVMAPASPPTQWALHDRISWAANLVLALLGYFAMWIALSTLKKIERQMKQVEDAVSLAASTGRTALLNVEAVIRAERPWIMITAEPSPDTANTSIVVATNRGKSPAKIIAMADQTLAAIDEAHLPSFDVAIDKQSGVAQSIILLPGESTAIRIFGREDVVRFCATEETLKRVEDWQEKVFITGKVIYKDLNTSSDAQTHESSWACWYIYGPKKSGLVTVQLPGLTFLT